MPCGRQYHDGTLPWPPLAMSSRFASKTFWYSGVSGAFWPACTQRGTPTRFHCPLRSGYLASSQADAPLMVAHKARSAHARIETRLDMIFSHSSERLSSRRHDSHGRSENVGDFYHGAAPQSNHGVALLR